jgi:hypothetical protein
MRLAYFGRGINASRLVGNKPGTTQLAGMSSDELGIGLPFSKPRPLRRVNSETKQNEKTMKTMIDIVE